MDQTVAETESLAAYDAVPLAAYGTSADGQRYLLSQRVRTGWRGLRELHGAPAVLAEPIERGHVRLELTISRMPDPRIGSGEVVVAATYADFEDAPGLHPCFALIAKGDAFPLPELDEAAREQLAEALAKALLRELEVL
jgi:hypothetical protein